MKCSNTSDKKFLAHKTKMRSSSAKMGKMEEMECGINLEGLCVGTAQTDKEGTAMRKLIFVLLATLSLILLLATKAS